MEDITKICLAVFFGNVVGYAIISRKRVYNGTLLLFDGNKWFRLDGGKA